MQPDWIITYHTNSYSKRAKRWYRVSRAIFVDNGWFELYWHPDTSLRGDNVAALRKLAAAKNVPLQPGTFHDKAEGRRGAELEKG